MSKKRTIAKRATELNTENQQLRHNVQRANQMIGDLLRAGAAHQRIGELEAKIAAARAVASRRFASRKTILAILEEPCQPPQPQLADAPMESPSSGITSDAPEDATDQPETETPISEPCTPAPKSEPAPEKVPSETT